MTAYEFIFSDKLKHRLARHLAFWAIYYTRIVLLYLPDVKIKTLTDTGLYLNALQDALNFLPVYLFSVYVTIYFILPKYLAKKNILFLVLSSLILITVSISSAYFISITIFEKSGVPWTQQDLITLVFYRCRGSLIAITSAAVIIKIMKDYSLKQRESEMLAIENVRNKLQLLKMQMHPRILFECLHNIYIDIDAGTTHAPQMILKLSDLLSYLLYETELKQVALNKEVKMIQNYIALKKLEHKNKLDIHFEINGQMNTHHITPGLFLPLLETGIVPFENLDNLFFVSIELKTTASKIYFSLKNNISSIQIMKIPSVQATLDSIKKRLQISYSDKFKLENHCAVNGFEITLQIESDKTINLQNQNIQNSETLIYEHS